MENPERSAKEGEKCDEVGKIGCNRTMKQLDRTLALAPMLDWTDRHFRYLARLLSPHLLLYTEMIPVGALIHGSFEQSLAGHLAHHIAEHPVALQLGGGNPADLIHAAKIGAEAGFDEININAGCPSERVSAGAFGIALFREPERVAEAVAGMVEAVSVPVTVKTRIGVDEIDSFDYLCRFVERLKQAGVSALIIHARMAYPSQYSPRQNRSVPPLRYEVVYALKQQFPDLPVVINGEISSLDQVRAHLQQVDGVMIGRPIFARPAFLTELEQALYDDPLGRPSIEEVVGGYLRYLEAEWGKGSPSVLIKPLFGLYHGQPGGRVWRQALSQMLQRCARESAFGEIRARILASIPSGADTSLD
jgi:tRNA-dihydrouridine synthase A